MSAILTATDYSRPVQSLFERPIQVGSVHSVFQRAMNITFGDTLLSILSDALPRMPNSIRLPALQAERLLVSVRPGMAVLAGNVSLPPSVGAGEGLWRGGDPLGRPCGRENVPKRIGIPVTGDPEGPYPVTSSTPAPTGMGGPTSRLLSIPACDVFISLPSMAVWEPRPQLATYQWDYEVGAYHVRTLAHYLQEVAHEQGLAALVCPLLLHTSTYLNAVAQKALPMLRLLMQAARERNRSEVERAACGLLGLGPGLTPSGDDVLAGFVAVMVLLSARLSVDGLPREDVALWIAALAPSCTTQLSATLLAYAARGEVAESLGNVLVALASAVEATEEVIHAACGLLRFGATSGGDTLLGVLLGMRVLLPFATYADTGYNGPDSG